MEKEKRIPMENKKVKKIITVTVEVIIFMSSYFVNVCI